MNLSIKNVNKKINKNNMNFVSDAQKVCHTKQHDDVYYCS